MKWPKEVVSAVSRALEIEPADGLRSDQVLQSLLDETARRAVWRAQGDPSKVGQALRSPFTPLGSVVADGIVGRAKRLTLHGDRWNVAVDAIHGYIELNARAVVEAYRDEMEPYDDAVGQGWESSSEW